MRLSGRKKIFNADALKLIAIFAMTLDHAAWTFFPGYDVRPGVVLLHLIGRITAPIMCFFIAEGYYYTKNFKKYALRLLILAVISHFAYNFCFGISFIPFKDSVFNQTSVALALFCGLISLKVLDSKKLKDHIKYLIVILLCAVSFCADWSSIAVLVIINFYSNRGSFKKQSLWLLIFVSMYAAVYFFFIDKIYGVLQLGVVLSLPLIYLYNGKKGNIKEMKWFFYIYYPVHLALFGILRLLLN